MPSAARNEKTKLIKKPMTQSHLFGPAAVQKPTTTREGKRTKPLNVTFQAHGQSQSQRTSVIQIKTMETRVQIEGFALAVQRLQSNSGRFSSACHDHSFARRLTHDSVIPAEFTHGKTSKTFKFPQNGATTAGQSSKHTAASTAKPHTV